MERNKQPAGRVRRAPSATARLAETVYARIKSDLFEFRLMPGERFSENEVARRLGVSRTPVREALFQLGQEGYIQVASKSGWSVRPIDFAYFENLYDLRVILETASVIKICETDPMDPLETLRASWLVPERERLSASAAVAALDERFHATIVEAAGNPEVSRAHRDVTERIRIIRRLDFTSPDRIRATYAEHAQILRKILRRKADDAVMLLRSHIELSRAEVRKITLHTLHSLHQPKGR
jgi:DNA-binding GntR family transcriptional regulator